MIPNGYADPTARIAISNVMREMRRRKAMQKKSCQPQKSRKNQP